MKGWVSLAAWGYLEIWWCNNNNTCHLITSKQSCTNLKIGNVNTKNSTCEKLLRVQVDNYIITCSKLTIETLEQGVSYVQS